MGWAEKTCGHPEDFRGLPPTTFKAACPCGQNYSCPTCGFGSFCYPHSCTMTAGPDDEHARQIAEIRWINVTGRVMTSEAFRNHVTWLLAEVDRLTEDLAAARESSARWLGFLRNVHDDLETGGTSLEELRTARRLLLQDLRRALDIDAQEARP